MNSEDISPSYLASLESNGKTLLTVDNATSNSVRLIMTTEASQYISIVCDPGETCYFEYTRDVATVTNYLSVDNGEYNAYNWNGSCIVETINQLEQCNVSEGTLLHVAVSEF
ncbi:hypothetical protein MRY82_01250 [bacterium]|nr:hypothetical protein [bacterium]